MDLTCDAKYITRYSRVLTAHECNERLASSSPPDLQLSPLAEIKQQNEPIEHELTKTLKKQHEVQRWSM